tara:strand:+ start:505 stop:1101 length:597 start_codon:yes stop_codon:yes gene_type:complete
MNKFVPKYIENYDFDQESYDVFVNTPIDGSQLDEYNNLIMRSNIDEEGITDVDNFLWKISPRKNTFSQVQVENFFDTGISEFQEIELVDTNSGSPTEISEFASEVDAEIGEQLANEQILQTQVEELSNTLDIEIEKGVKLKEDATETYQAAKDLIVSQRISAGEGQTSADFSNKFPFLPLSEGEEETSGDKFPFMKSP